MEEMSPWAYQSGGMELVAAVAAVVAPFFIIASRTKVLRRFTWSLAAFAYRLQ